MSRSTQPQPPSPVRIVKTMSLSRTEFEKSIAVLGAAASPARAGDRVELAIGGESAGRATIDFAPLAPRRLGGLLLLPQARVTIEIEDAGEADVAEFLQRFELAFQRGGG
ncbi:MAG: hypothetical protein AB7E80_14990 [Hyphomicrobiaceae bacterium]